MAKEERKRRFAHRERWTLTVLIDGEEGKEGCEEASKGPTVG
jgi:hypothetical protein